MQIIPAQPQPEPSRHHQIQSKIAALQAELAAEQQRENDKLDLDEAIALASESRLYAIALNKILSKLRRAGWINSHSVPLVFLNGNFTYSLDTGSCITRLGEVGNPPVFKNFAEEVQEVIKLNEMEIPEILKIAIEAKNEIQSGQS